MGKATRYDQLLTLVEETKPSIIVEIGTNNGLRATLMAEVALKHSPNMHYIGYDLFQEASSETDEDELNFKRHSSLDQVARKLEDFKAKFSGFSFELHKGNTRETLKKEVGDFVFIDGGHSVETIRHDYEAVKESRVIVFDDYYKLDGIGIRPDIGFFGANKIVDEIEGHEILPSVDRVRGGGIVCLAVVRNERMV